MNSVVIKMIALGGYRVRTIIVREYASMALTEKDGLKLRIAIEQLLTGEKTITLDFSDISLFATMFFNASIGHLVLQLTPEKCQERIKIANISELGRETYQHTLENAKEIFSQNAYIQKIADVTENNLENI
jgi:hypothetical protein